MARAAIYVRADALASRLVSKYDQGGVFVIQETVTQPPNPIDPPVIVETETAIKLVARGTSQSFLSGDPNLVATDVMILMDSQQWYKPTIEDKIRLNGDVKKVVRVDRIVAAGDPSAYRFFVR